VLIGCEYTGIGQAAFEAAGHDAWSCDLEPTEGRKDRHLQMDIFDAIYNYGDWDLIILHPDCTYMAVCGNRHHADTDARMTAIAWTLDLWALATANSKRVCLENPVSVVFPYLRDLGADVQYVHPWQFGHPETKKTGLALHGLPRLKPTDDVYEHMMTLPKKERHKIWYASPSETRGKDRSRSYPGILKAMAERWG
jgi:hypothetical protein